MHKTLITGIIIVSNLAVAFGQAKKAGKDSASLHLAPIAPPKTSSITFHLNKIPGVGPNGFNSIGIATTATYDTSKIAEYQQEYKAYPRMKGKPGGLTDVKEYFFILNYPQFYYQNYVAGVYTKEFLFKKLNQSKFALADTATLSRKPLLCYFSALVGFKADKSPVYILDTNNNGDYADDELKPLLKSINDEDLLVKASQPVSITYLYNGQIKGGTRQVIMQQSFNPTKFDVSFSFPEFGFMRFTYKGASYMICSDGNPLTPFYTVVPDRPYFARLNRDKGVRSGQFAQLGDDNFKLSAVTDDGSEITLTGDDISGFSSKQTVKIISAKDGVKSNGSIVSRQPGFKAPLIKGVNINTQANLGSVVSTASLKGKYVFIDFWSTSCGPCIQEFDNLKEVYTKYGGKKLEIIGVVDEREKDATIKLLKEHKILWPNIKDNAKTTQIDGYEDINSYPTSYLLDPTGKIIATDLRNEALMNKLKSLIGV